MDTNVTIEMAIISGHRGIFGGHPTGYVNEIVQLDGIPAVGDTIDIGGCTCFVKSRHWDIQSGLHLRMAPLYTGSYESGNSTPQEVRAELVEAMSTDMHCRMEDR